MCVALFTLDHPDYALSVSTTRYLRTVVFIFAPSILCSNRDEEFARPTEPAHFHRAFGTEQVDILSGLDVQAGGTWLGLTRSGKFALLTNITEAYGSFGPSRGRLVSSFLGSPPSPRPLQEDVQRLIPRDASYAGFNLLLLAPQSTSPFAFDAIYVTNRGAGGPIISRALTDAERHRSALSNGIDGAGADDWPKVQHGVRALDDLLSTLPPNTSEDHLTERLFDLLTWRSSQTPRDRSELKHTIQVEPIELPHGLYGTRLSTIVLVRRSGDVIFTERDRWTLTTDGRPILADPSSQRVFRFKI